MLDDDSDADGYEDQAADGLDAASDHLPYHGPEVSAHQAQHERDRSYDQHGQEDGGLEKGEAEAHRESVYACGDRQHQEDRDSGGIKPRA